MGKIIYIIFFKNYFINYKIIIFFSDGELSKAELISGFTKIYNSA